MNKLRGPLATRAALAKSPVLRTFFLLRRATSNISEDANHTLSLAGIQGRIGCVCAQRAGKDTTNPYEHTN